eukprot:1160558-Pelagomonas_calceolata.AAC.11
MCPKRSVCLRSLPDNGEGGGNDDDDGETPFWDHPWLECRALCSDVVPCQPDKCADGVKLKVKG